MTIRAIVFDIGGVLEITPDLGVTEKWEQILQLPAGALNTRMADVWQAGSLGECTEEDVQRSLVERLGMNQQQIENFMQDVWEEYLGMLNVEMADYFSDLRSHYKTAIISNSFVGARSREQERYHFHEMTDLIIYSHEVGVAKPDRRIYQLTWKRLGVQPAEMIFLDDNERPVVAARALGIHAILFKDNTQAIAEIQALLQTNAQTLATGQEDVQKSGQRIGICAIWHGRSMCAISRLKASSGISWLKSGKTAATATRGLKALALASAKYCRKVR